MDCRKGGDRDAESRKEGLFPQAILGNRKDLGSRCERQSLRNESGGFGGNILELIGRNVDGRRKSLQRSPIVIGRFGMRDGYIESGIVAGGRVNMAFESKPCGGERQHAAQLPPAQDADHRTRPKGFDEPQGKPP
jgi:hypothetical protein